jgi:hypothetical protein
MDNLCPGRFDRSPGREEEREREGGERKEDGEWR